MATGAINLDTVTPAEYVVPSIVTSSSSVLRKTLVEIAPHSQFTFTQAGNNIIRFTIADTTGILIGSESYLRFEVYRTDGVSNYDARTVLSVPGTPAFVRKSELKQISSGMSLERLTKFNQQAAIQSHVLSGLTDVHQHGWIFGDSLTDDGQHQLMTARPLRYVLDSSTTATIAADANTLTIGARENGKVRFKAGDVLVFSYTDTGPTPDVRVTHVCTVSSATPTTLTFSPDLPNAPGGVFVVNAIVSHGQAAPERRRLCNTSGVANAQVVLMPLPSIWLQQDIPLFLLQGGLEHEIELEYPDRVFRALMDPATASTAFDYAIQKPRIQAMISVPESSVMQDYVQRWNSERGIILYSPQYLVRNRQNNETGNVTISYNVGVRSARMAYFVLYWSTFTNANGALARTVDGNSTFLRTKISSFQVRIGAHDFPLRKVEAYKNEPREMYYHLRLVRPDLQQNFRFHREEALTTQNLYSSTAADPTIFQENTKWIMGVNFSRSNLTGSALSGTDVSLVPIQLMLERDDTLTGTLQDQYDYTAFIFYDAFWKMSSRQSTILN